MLSKATHHMNTRGNSQFKPVPTAWVKSDPNTDLVQDCKEEVISFNFSTDVNLLREYSGVHCSAIIPAGSEGSSVWRVQCFFSSLRSCSVLYGSVKHYQLYVKCNDT